MKLSGWTVDSQEFRKIDWVTFSERIVAQSCNFIQDSWLLVASEVSEGGVWCVCAWELWRQVWLLNFGPFGVCQDVLENLIEENYSSKVLTKKNYHWLSTCPNIWVHISWLVAAMFDFLKVLFVLCMVYYLTIVETVTFWLYKPTLWPWPRIPFLHDIPAHGGAPQYQVWLQKVAYEWVQICIMSIIFLNPEDTTVLSPL